MAALCASLAGLAAYVEDLVNPRPCATFLYDGQAVSVRVPRTAEQVAATYGRLRRAFKLADNVIISAFFVDVHMGGPLWYVHVRACSACLVLRHCESCM
jgi:hypothetical protein